MVNLFECYPAIYLAYKLISEISIELGNVIQTILENTVQSCVFSSTGILVSGTYNDPTYLRFWDPISGTLLKTFVDQLAVIVQIVISSTGLLAVAGLNGEIVIYSL